MSIAHTKEYNQGYKAGWDAVLCRLDIECPYVLNSQAYEDWYRGLYDTPYTEMKSMGTTSGAYKGGVYACMDGLPESDNPYDYGSIDWEDWMDGYYDYLRGSFD